MPTETVLLTDATATAAHGAACARRLPGAGVPIAIVGELGAGKTTWVRGLARELGVTSAVRSPTYTYRLDYPLPDGRMLSHVDLYRLPEGADLTGFGLDELAADPGTILAIEWAEHLPFALPPSAWRVHLLVTVDGTRVLTLTVP